MVKSLGPASTYNLEQNEDYPNFLRLGKELGISDISEYEQKYANNLFLCFLDQSCVFSKTANRATISSEYEAKQSKMEMETKKGQKRNQLYQLYAKAAKILFLRIPNL